MHSFQVNVTIKSGVYTVGWTVKGGPCGASALHSIPIDLGHFPAIWLKLLIAEWQLIRAVYEHALLTSSRSFNSWALSTSVSADISVGLPKFCGQIKAATYLTDPSGISVNVLSRFRPKARQILRGGLLIKPSSEVKRIYPGLAKC